MPMTIQSTLHRPEAQISNSSRPEWGREIFIWKLWRGWRNKITNTVIDYLKVTINALLFLHSDWLSVMNRQTLRELSGVVVASLTGSTPELSPTSTSWPWSSMSDPTVSSPACWWYYSSSTGWTSGSSPRRSTWWSGPTARVTTTWWRFFSWKLQADTIIQSMRHLRKSEF